MSHPFDEAELHDLAAALAQSDDAVRDTIEQIRRQHAERQFTNLIAIGFSVTQNPDGVCRSACETFLCVRSAHDAMHGLEALHQIEQMILEKLARGFVRELFQKLREPTAE